MDVYLLLNKLKTKTKTKVNFILYYTIIQSIPRQWRYVHIPPTQRKQTGPGNYFLDNILESTNVYSKKAYTNLLHKETKSPEKTLMRWEKEVSK